MDGYLLNAIQGASSAWSVNFPHTVMCYLVIVTTLYSILLPVGLRT